jgi:protein-L-isoaspartate(D-aspartate) O-methyltransferase
MDRRAALLKAIDEETAQCAAWTGRENLSPRVRSAIKRVRREAFLPSDEADRAYRNAPLPIGYGQTISQPFIVAIMTELLDLESGATVLEVGTGSGYQAAVLAQIARQVYSIELIPALAARAAEALRREGYDNVEVRAGDGSLGWPQHAPFDAIIVTAAADEIPVALVRQLKSGGRMIVPIGPRHGAQSLILVRKSASGTIDTREILPVAFVPLIQPERMDCAGQRRRVEAENHRCRQPIATMS